MGFTIHKPKWRGILVLVLVLCGVTAAVFLITRNNHKKSVETSKKQLQNVAESIVKFPSESSPSKEYNEALKNFSEKTQDVKEKYLANVRLCYSYKTLNEYQSAKTYCEKAVALAKEAKADSEVEAGVEETLAFIKARLADSTQKNPQGSDDGFKEPAN